MGTLPDLSLIPEVSSSKYACLPSQTRHLASFPRLLCAEVKEPSCLRVFFGALDFLCKSEESRYGQNGQLDTFSYWTLIGDFGLVHPSGSDWRPGALGGGAGDTQVHRE